MRQYRKDIIEKCGKASIALLVTAGAFGFYGMEFSYRAIVFFVAAYAMYVLTDRAFRIKNRSILWVSAIYSLLLAGSFAVGHQNMQWEKPWFPDLTLLDWAYLLPYAGMLFILVLNLIDWILQNDIPLEKTRTVPSRKYWRNAFLILMALWLPYFMVFYPGNLSLDSFECVQQAIGDVPYGNNHPAAFVAMIAVFMKLGMMIGDINFGIACYSMVQLLIFSGILSYVLYWMKNNGVPDWMIFLCGAFYGLNPMIGTFSVIIWKDVLFGAFLLLLVTWLYDVAQSHGQILSTAKGVVMFAMIALFLSLWRNSMAGGICFLSVILICCYRKYIRYFFPVCLVVICVIYAVLGPVYGTIGIPEANNAESLGIPIQQIGYTLEQGGTVDEESREFLNKIMPTEEWAEKYRPRSSDSVKFNASFNHEFFNANRGKFIKVWLKLMPANLKTYCKAWLMNTIGYYHIGTIETAYWYGIIPVDRAAELGVVRTDLIEKFTGIDIIARLIEAFLFYAKKLPLFSTLYSIAASVWVFFLGIAVSFLRRRGCRTYLWSMLPLMVLWGVIMATTPAFCEFRYMFAFHLALPIFGVFMFCQDNERNLV